jgi:hypothetical protein
LVLGGGGGAGLVGSGGGGAAGGRFAAWEEELLEVEVLGGADGNEVEEDDQRWDRTRSRKTIDAWIAIQNSEGHLCNFARFSPGRNVSKTFYISGRREYVRREYYFVLAK